MQNGYRKLLGRIVEKEGTQSSFASKMGLSERTVSLKVNGKVAWKQSEIAKSCEVLDIPLEEIPAYFFTQEVQQIEHRKDDGNERNTGI